MTKNVCEQNLLSSLFNFNPIGQLSSQLTTMSGVATVTTSIKPVNYMIDVVEKGTLHLKCTLADWEDSFSVEDDHGTASQPCNDIQKFVVQRR